MKYFILINFVITCLSISTFCNNTLPKDVLQTDTLEYCKKIVDEIKALKLYSDTVFSDFSNGSDFYQYKVIYFDEKKQLRKYMRKEEVHDGTSECIDMKAYYDQSGNLVHIDIISSDVCDSDNEYFYVYKGRVVDYGYEGDCFCCEEENSDNENSETENGEKKFWYPTNLPVKGDTINKTVGWELSLKHFIYADSLVVRLKSDKYYNNSEFSDDK